MYSIRSKAGSDGTPLESDAEERQSFMELPALQSVKTELSGITGAKISCVAVVNNHFVAALDGYVRRHSIQLIIMGMTGAHRGTNFHG